MNRISFSLLTILAATVLFTACQKDSEHLVDLSAVIADQSGSNAKVYINGNYGCWQQGDVVKVKSGSNGTNNYSLKVEGSGVAADKATIKDVVEGTPYTAGYPGGNVTSIGDGTLNIEVPSSQSYVEAAIYNGAATNEQRIVCPMAAYSSDGSTLKFYNVAAMLAVTVTNSESSSLTLYAVEVESDKSPLSGTATVTVNADTAYISSKASTSNNVTLTFGTTVTLVANASKTVYIPVLPIGSGEGEKSTLTVHVKATANADGTGSKYTFHGVSRQPLSIAQNQMGNVPISLNTNDPKTEVNDYFWGQGTEACPYLITDTTDLFRLRDLVSHFHLGSYNDVKYNTNDIYYLQTANLDISDSTTWGSNGHPAIGSTANPFMANYNGGNHTITLGVTSATAAYPVGVFGVVGNGANISYLNTDGSVNIGNKATHVGSIVGKITGGATISNCSNSATITSSNSSIFGDGGICGGIESDGYTVQLTNCSNNGAISSGGHPSGGIVGYHIDGTLQLTNCNNNAAVTNSYSSSGVYCGGIIGYINAGDENVTLTSCSNLSSGTVRGYNNVGGLIGKTGMETEINSCNNAASVSSYTSGNSYRYNIGGMIGLSEASTTFKGNNNQTGNVLGYYYVGGVIGQNTKALKVDNGATVTVGSTSSGITVEYKGSVTCTTYTGTNNGSTALSNSVATAGFVGYSYGMVVEGTVNLYGEVKNADGASTRACVGGLIGAMRKNDYNSTGTNLQVKSTGVVNNHLNVTGTSHVGGLVGYGINIIMNGNHHNYGRITGTSNVGGIVGYNLNYALTISGNGDASTSNNGVIDGSSYYVGGIVGYTSGSNVTLEKCANNDSVIGSYDVGGIIGKADPNNAQRITWVHYCNNSGVVKAKSYASAKGVAGIMGNVTNSKTVHLHNCSNSGKIECTNGGNYITIGGIGGYINGKGTILNCYNTGEIHGSSAYSMGGICGRTYNNDTISNCYNHGEITGTVSGNGSGAAGIVGESRGAGVRLNNCYNKSKLSGVTSGTKYGVFGIYSGTVYLHNCYGPASLTLAGKTSGGTIYTYRCTTLVESNGVVTGDLTTAVKVNTENNGGIPAADAPTYSTLADVLTAWRTKVGGVSSPLGWSFLSWTDDTFPTFN